MLQNEDKRVIGQRRKEEPRFVIRTLSASMVLLRRSVSFEAKYGAIVYEYLKIATKEYHDAATHPR
jgi:hypothetical protein